MDILQHMPSSSIKSYLFKNNANLTFSNTGKLWGIDSSSNSNGAAYADLDNDGDLDLIVNNINKPAFIYRNETDCLKSHYLEVALKGAGKNTQGIGAKLIAYVGNKQQYLEQMPAKGYMSSVSPVLHIGAGKDTLIDSLKVTWQSGKAEVIRNISVNQFISFDEKNALVNSIIVPATPTFFSEIKAPLDNEVTANLFNDFTRQPLLINPLSFSGPCIIKGDVNADQIEDIYVGGGNGSAGNLFIQQQNGSFIKKAQPAFEANKMSQDVDGLFFDADADGDMDLYVVSGGYYQFAANDPLLQDRLYFNDGAGNFTQRKMSLPLMHVSKSCVRPADINGDGFIDLFAGGRVVPGKYPVTPESFILINDGKGNFSNQTKALAPELQYAGMITDAVWTDLNNDKKADLIVVGEWMPISVYINSQGKLINSTNKYFDKNYSGWWNKILAKDLNGDGKTDLVIGNLGQNSQCRATDQSPAEMYYKDFDDNGTIEPILCFYVQGKSYPFITKDELVSQVNGMGKKFLYYKDYADAGLQDVFTEDQLKGANYLKANELSTCYFEQQKDGKFHKKNFPVQAQFAPVFTITDIDYNNDGNTDILLCGNLSHARIRFGNYDANYGVLLNGDGKGNFRYVNQQQSGFHLRGDVRSVEKVKDKLLFGINNKKIICYQLK